MPLEDEAVADDIDEMLRSSRSIRVTAAQTVK